MNSIHSGLGSFTVFPVAAPVNMPGYYGIWPERRPSQFSESQRRSSSVRATFHPPPCTEDRPSELEARLDLLQSQLNRCVDVSVCVCVCVCVYICVCMCVCVMNREAYVCQV